MGGPREGGSGATDGCPFGGPPGPSYGPAIILTSTLLQPQLDSCDYETDKRTQPAQGNEKRVSESCASPWPQYDSNNSNGSKAAAAKRSQREEAGHFRLASVEAVPRGTDQLAVAQRGSVVQRKNRNEKSRTGVPLRHF
jgi:hypothetical protein